MFGFFSSFTSLSNLGFDVEMKSVPWLFREELAVAILCKTHAVTETSTKSILPHTATIVVLH